MSKEKIVYVNYSPYENQGGILDYLIETHSYVFQFSIGHHELGGKNRSNKLIVYKQGKIIEEKNLYHLPIPSQLVFLLLPIRSLINLYQILINAYLLKRRFGLLDRYFTVNGYTAWVGLVCRKFRLVNKIIFWVCDYYPIQHPNKLIYFMRWLYWQFEKQTVSCDVLAFHNKRLVNVWKEKGILFKNYKSLLVPIGTKKRRAGKIKSLKIVKLCFLGVLKKSQGLDFVFDSDRELYERFPGMVVNIIGPGPDGDYFKKRARKSKLKYVFHGYLSDNQIDKVISSSTIGLALYVPDPSNVSYYGDPGKIKRYISLSVPVIATNIHEFTQEMLKKEAGVVVTYGKSGEMIKAVGKIVNDYKKYCRNAIDLNKQYYYKHLYNKMFVDIKTS